MKKALGIFLVWMIFSYSSACAQQLPTQSQLKFFETKIRPALVKYCYECHSVEGGDGRGGLMVDTRRGLLEGGDNGSAIEPGSLEDSLFWDAINWDGYEMPPSKKMPESVIADFKKWIEMGAPDPREREKMEFRTKISSVDIAKAGQEHWAFQPPDSHKDSSIDSLVNSKLASAGIVPAEPADPFTLLRRIHFDLIGLPPTPNEIQAFHTDYQNDPETAVQVKVEELLSSPRYGERWGRHWLDVARYAESSGSRNVSYPHAWRYRDYVIDSFNDDTPYDRFISEQIAGDLLPADDDEQWQENLIATGFLAIGLKHHDEKNPRKFQSDMVDEQVDTMSKAVLGLTIACARCHDHKTDPIPTDDYYSLAGIFYSTETFYGTSRIAQNHRPSELLLLPVPEEDKQGNSKTSRQALKDMQERLDGLDQQMRKANGKERRNIRNARNRIAAQLAALNADGTPKSFGMGVQEAREMVNAHILLGGEIEQPAQEVTRGFVQVLGDLNFAVDNHKSSGRLELAQSLTSKDNPLTARVMVNRIWMHLLGNPLVETPSNFGLSGVKPENQELLDHLAVQFMEGGWSVKNLIGKIIASDAYQRSSNFHEDNYAVDPDNKLLWRANPRTLDAESLRDAMLALSGRLNVEKPASSTLPRIGNRRGAASTYDTNRHRSVYLPVVRDNLPASLELFDFPDPNVSSPGRAESIVPTQALYLMNSEFVFVQANAMAVNLEKRFGTTNEQVQNAFLWVYGRPATKAEIRASVEFFQTFKSRPIGSAENNLRRGSAQSAPRRGGRRGAPNAPATSPSNQALAVFCQTLMASARFRILN